MNDENTTPRENPHRCVELNLSGYPCGLRAVAGHDRCYIHGIFQALNDGRSTIDIPLLEDPKSILFVYSQVARALAQGAMPAANANGIIRCCNGAMKLLTEMRKHERFEERRKQKAEDRSQQSVSAEPAASPLAKDQQDQMHATVPPNLEVSEDASQPATAVVAAVPDARSDTSDASDPGITLQATAESDFGETGPKPHARTAEPMRNIVPPLQFGFVPERFDTPLARIGGDMTLTQGIRAISAHV